MGDPGDLSPREQALREDLGREYYALVDAVAGFDGRLMIVKGWSVTLSLVALGLGFQQQHYALFGLAAATALGFWGLDVLTKTHQVRHYSRMRDIEVAAYRLNSIDLGDGIGTVSAPRIDMYWSYRGQAHDWRTDAPERRSVLDIRRGMRRPWVMPQVLLPHWVAVAIGVALFVWAAAGWTPLASLEP
jgi:hypothetical protein